MRMTNDTKPTAVTKQELYPILGSVYLLIGFALLGVFRPDENILLTIGHYLLFGVAVVSSVTFTVLGLREMTRAARKKNNDA
jgi:amino acid transporter